MENDNQSQNINNEIIFPINESNTNKEKDEKDEKEIIEYSKFPNFNSDNNNENSIKINSIKNELLSNIENINPNIHTMQNEVNFIKKWNNNRVNGALNDIYGSIANINEVNKKVKNLLSNMPIIHETKSSKNNFISRSKNINKMRPATEEKIINKKKKFIKLNEIKDSYYPATFINYNNPNSAKNYYSYDIKNDINYNNNINYSMINNQIINPNIKHKQKKINKEISQIEKNNLNNSNNTNNIYTNNYIKPIPKKEIKIILNKREKKNNMELNNLKEKDDFDNNEDIEKVSNNLSMVSSLVNSEFVNINNNSLYFDEELKNEKDIKNIKLKLKKEEKKLKELEKEKHRLLKEEKNRRKIIMENIQKRNKIKKIALLKEYQKKINLVKKLQAQNINEIIQLERKKKKDESKIRKINNLFNNDNIDEEINNPDLYKIIKKNKKKSRKNRNNDVRENNLDEIKHKIYESRNEDSKIKKYFTFSDGFEKIKNSNINEENVKEENINEEYKFINTLNDLSSSYNNSNKTKSLSSYTNNYQKISNNYNKSNSQKTLFKNLDNNYSDKNIKKVNLTTNKYNFIYNDNDDINYNNIRISLKDYINEQNTEKKKKYNKFKSDSRLNQNYNYKKILSPKIEIPSFIKARVNKYNHNNSQKSSSSQRFVGSQMFPYSLNYNLNYNNNFPSNISNKSNQNYFSKNSDKRDYKKRSRKSSRDLNFKYMFFNE